MEQSDLYIFSTGDFAKTWGSMKTNRSEEMNYEKISRAMRSVTSDILMNGDTMYLQVSLWLSKGRQKGTPRHGQGDEALLQVSTVSYCTVSDQL